MPCGHDRRVVFVFERGRPKIDQPDLGIEEYPPLRGVPIDRRRRGGNSPVVCERLVVVVAEEDVLWLEIGVDKV
jgi:hypothetical protein